VSWDRLRKKMTESLVSVMKGGLAGVGSSGEKSGGGNKKVGKVFIPRNPVSTSTSSSREIPSSASSDERLLLISFLVLFLKSIVWLVRSLLCSHLSFVCNSGYCFVFAFLLVPRIRLLFVCSVLVYNVIQD